MNKDISIIELIQLVFKKLWLVIVMSIVCGTLLFIYSKYYLTPTYVSRGMIYVDNSNVVRIPSELTEEDVKYADLVASQRLATVYIEILKSRTFLKIVKEQCGVDITVEKLASIIEIKSKNDTEILEISVVHTNPYHAQAITETFLENSKVEIPRIFKGGSVEIIDHADIPLKPSGPSHVKNALIGILLGIILSVILIFLLDLLDNTIRGQDDLIDKYKYPILGSIPNTQKRKKTIYGYMLKADKNKENELKASQ